MKLLKNLTNFRPEKEPQPKQAASKQKSAKPAPTTGQLAASLWPLVRSNKADWLRFYQAMDTAG